MLRVEVHAPPAELAGVSLYARRLHRHLAGLADARLRERWSREWTIAGRKVGGNLTRLASRALSRGRGDVVHAADPFSAPRLGRLDVLTVHDMLALDLPDLYGGSEAALFRATLRDALARDPLVITPTAAARDALLRHVDVDPARVVPIHHGVDEHVLAAADAARERPAPLREGRRTALLTMDDNPRKRADLALEALAGIPDIDVVHVGQRRPSYPRHVEAVERAAGPLVAQGRYTRLERVEPARLGALYRHADLAVHLTRDEGFGWPPLEALACGTPPLVSDIPVLREVLGPHGHYAPMEVGAVREAAERLLASPPDPAPGVAYARAFTWDRCARRTLEVYEAAAARRRGG